MSRGELRIDEKGFSECPGIPDDKEGRETKIKAERREIGALEEGNDDTEM